jgi:hypothetical protein
LAAWRCEDQVCVDQGAPSCSATLGSRNLRRYRAWRDRLNSTGCRCRVGPLEVWLDGRWEQVWRCASRLSCHRLLRRSCAIASHRVVADMRVSKMAGTVSGCRRSCHRRMEAGQTSLPPSVCRIRSYKDGDRAVKAVTVTIIAACATITGPATAGRSALNWRMMQGAELEQAVRGHSFTSVNTNKTGYFRPFREEFHYSLMWENQSTGLVVPGGYNLLSDRVCIFVEERLAECQTFYRIKGQRFRVERTFPDAKPTFFIAISVQD